VHARAENILQLESNRLHCSAAILTMKLSYGQNRDAIIGLHLQYSSVLLSLCHLVVPVIQQPEQLVIYMAVLLQNWDCQYICAWNIANNFSAELHS
jgi:hypothetical protein